MEKHIHTCQSNTKTASNNVKNEAEEIAGTYDSSTLWKSGQKCPFGCQGLWQNQESLEGHKRDSFHQHLQRLNWRVARLEVLNRPITIKENGKNDMNVPMVGSQQPSNSPLETNFEMMEDMEENVEGAAAVSSSSATSSGIYRNNKARLELEVQRLSEPLQTLEKQQQLEIQRKVKLCRQQDVIGHNILIIVLCTTYPLYNPQGLFAVVHAAESKETCAVS